MSKVVDDRVVEMRFDNRQFESNVKTSISTLDRLKKALSFSGAAKGLDEINSSAKNNQLPALGSAVESVSAKFSALQVMGVTALANITNSAVNAGKRMAEALTIDPIKTGFQEYETQINSVQTILANTESKGTTLNQVNAALDELNKYADQTIYNFTEMTRNIGTFTAAGVDLQTSVSAIKGIANLAAISGSTSQQASTAMYQLSQALAAGKVQLMDWNSVVNAGMGGEVFQNALKRTATQMGTNVDALIEKYGSFRESLTQGNWLTAEVLTETLTQLSGAYTEADLIAQGYTEKQAKDIVNLAKTAVSAATEVKTFTQLWDTMKEAVQSGWTQTWEILVGDFGEAKELLTGISNAFGEMINASAEARNKVLGEGLSSGWKQLMSSGIMDEGFFTDILTQTAKKSGVAIDEMVNKYGSLEKTLKQGWLTSDMLKESIGTMTDKINAMSQEELKAAGYTQDQIRELNNLNEAVKDGSINLDEYAKKMQQMSGRENIIAGIKNAFESLMSVVKPVREAFEDIFPPITGQQVYDMTEKFKKFTETLKPTEETLDRIKRAAKGFFSIFDLIGKGIGTILSPIGKLLGSDGAGGLFNAFLEGAARIGDFFTTLNASAETGDFFGGVSDSLSMVVDGISDFFATTVDKIGSFSDLLSTIGDTIVKVLGKIGEGVRNIFGWISDNISGGDVFAGLAGGGIFLAAKKLMGFLDGLKDGGLKGLIFGTGDKDDGGGLKDIAKNVSEALDSLKGSIEAFTSGIKVASLVGIATAIALLAGSLRKMAEIDFKGLVNGLLGLSGIMALMNWSFSSISSTLDYYEPKNMVKAGVSLVLLGYALEKFSDAMLKVSKLNFDDIGKGLIGIGGALAEFSGVLYVISKTSGKGQLGGAASIWIISQTLGKVAESLKNIGSMSWDTIENGLGGMAGALSILGTASFLTGLGGFSSVIGGSSILVAAQSLDEIADALKSIGSMNWSTIEKGIGGMANALGALGTINFLTGLGGFSSVVGAGSILVAVQSLGQIAEGLKNIGALSWDTIENGLGGMAGALSILGTASFLTGLGGLNSLAGAASLFIGANALGDICNALAPLGDMSWDAIENGLGGMAGALSILGTASFLTGLGGLASLVGSGTLNIAVQSLDDLADALSKFGSMDWDSIGRGLTAMGLALGETALGSLLNTFSGFGADALSKVAEPLGALADSVKKWSGVTVPEGLGGQIGSLAGGIAAFSFSGWGAESIATLAAPLGVLADSVSKWSGVSVPEGLGTQISSLAGGIAAFNFSGWGSESIATLATPLGTLADSVGKWSSVVVPENMQANLTSLANGVKAFNFSGWAAEDMSSAVTPIGDLAGAIAKWAGVVVPEDMGTKLESLAKGVKAFNLGFFESGFDVAGAIGPIGDLAGAVSKWNGIAVPTNLGESLSSLASGLKSFKDANPGDISGTISSLDSLKNAVGNLATVDFVGVANRLNAFVTSLNSLNVSVPDLSHIGTSIVTSISSGISNGASIVTGAIRMVITMTIASAITESAKFKSGGTEIANKLASGIDEGKKTVDAPIRNLVSGASNTLNGYYGSFKSAGSYVASGFAAGIRSGITAAANAAARMASAASAAARRNLQIKSPSRVFREIGSYVPQGFAQGIDRFSYLAENSAVSMADNAVKSTSEVLSGLSKTLNLDADMDLNPVITPVLDLDNIKNGSSAIDDMLSKTAPIDVLRNVNTINRQMNRNLQNGANNEVVGAIDKLRKSMGDIGGNSYNINGITYDDGSAVSEAVQGLIRAIRIEGRV